MREMKVRVGDMSAKLRLNGVQHILMAGLFADDTVLLAESREMLQKVVDEFDTVCKRRKLKVNVGKSKVMVFERARGEMVEFMRPYRVRARSTYGRVQDHVRESGNGGSE